MVLFSEGGQHGEPIAMHVEHEREFMVKDCDFWDEIQAEMTSTDNFWKD